MGAFANSLGNGFTLDDYQIVVENTLIRHLGSLPGLFAQDYWAGTPIDSLYEDRVRPALYRPLTMVTYGLNHALGGLRPLGYHAVNVALHVAVSLLLHGLARRLGCGAWGAFWAAALFAVHPIHTEAVSGVVGRAEILMALGVLASLLTYAGPPDRLCFRRALLSLVCFAVALLAKEQAMVLPALLVAWDLARRHGSGGLLGLARTGGRRQLPYVIVLGAYLVLRRVVLGTVLGAGGGVSVLDNPLASASTAVRVLTALKVAGRYLWLFVWPAHLSADYSFDAIPLAMSPWEPGVLAGLGAWGGLVALGVAAIRTGSPAPALAAALAVVSFLPASNVLHAIGTIMGERLFYLPSAGLCLLVGLAVDRTGRHRAARTGATVALTVLVLAMTVRTAVRNRDWRDDRSLWESAARVVPRSAKVHHSLGALDADPERALQHLEDALRIYPRFVAESRLMALSYALALLRAGRPGDAIPVLEPLSVVRHPQVHYNLGLAYARVRRFEDAAGSYRTALAMKLDSPEILSSLSFVYLELGRTAEALETADEAVRLSPGFAGAHFNRGRALEALAALGEASDAYAQALRLQPDMERARARLERLGQQPPPGAPPTVSR